MTQNPRTPRKIPAHHVLVRRAETNGGSSMRKRSAHTPQDQIFSPCTAVMRPIKKTTREEEREKEEDSYGEPVHDRPGCVRVGRVDGRHESPRPEQRHARPQLGPGRVLRVRDAVDRHGALRAPVELAAPTERPAWHEVVVIKFERVCAHVRSGLELECGQGSSVRTVF